MQTAELRSTESLAAPRRPEGGAPPAQASAGGDAVVITPRAAATMRRQLERRGTPQAAIRFGIRGGGCTGYSYTFQFEDGEPRARDTVIEHDGVRVVIDPKSLLLVRGTRIDFETGIRGHGFRFENPNVKGSCGCGEAVSF